MKLSTQDKKKVAISLVMLVGVIYVYYSYAITPLNDKQRAAIKAFQALQPKIKTAKDQIARKDAEEAKFPETKLILDQVGLMIPQGAPLAWFPPRMDDISKELKLEKMEVDMSGEVPDKTNPKYRRIQWNVNVPKVDFLTMGRLLETIENQEPLCEIFNISVGVEGQESLRTSFKMVHIVK